MMQEICSNHHHNDTVMMDMRQLDEMIEEVTFNTTNDVFRDFCVFGPYSLSSILRTPKTTAFRN
jgi:hypothetical protein